MAGNEERDRVRAHRVAHGPAGPGHPDVPGNILVRDRLPKRDTDQGLPHLDLEVGPPHEKMKRGGLVVLGECKYLLHQGGGGPRAFHDFRPRPAAGQALHEHSLGGFLLHERQAADAPVRTRKETPSERRGVKTVLDGEAFSPRLDLSGGHGLAGDKKLVQPSRAREPRIIGHAENIP